MDGWMDGWREGRISIPVCGNVAHEENTGVHVEVGSRSTKDTVDTLYFH